MPNKHNAARRHHIPKMKFRVKNWADYDAGLRRRGSLRVRVTPEVLDGWHAARRTTPGGQSSYSELAIETGSLLSINRLHSNRVQDSGPYRLLEAPLLACAQVSVQPQDADA